MLLKDKLAKFLQETGFSQRDFLALVQCWHPEGRSIPRSTFRDWLGGTTPTLEGDIRALEIMLSVKVDGLSGEVTELTDGLQTIPERLERIKTLLEMINLDLRWFMAAPEVVRIKYASCLESQNWSVILSLLFALADEERLARWKINYSHDTTEVQHA